MNSLQAIQDYSLALRLQEMENEQAGIVSSESPSHLVHSPLSAMPSHPRSSSSTSKTSNISLISRRKPAAANTSNSRNTLFLPLVGPTKKMMSRCAMSMFTKKNVDPDVVDQHQHQRQQLGSPAASSPVIDHDIFRDQNAYHVQHRQGYTTTTNTNNNNNNNNNNINTSTNVIRPYEVQYHVPPTQIKHEVTFSSNSMEYSTTNNIPAIQPYTVSALESATTSQMSTSKSASNISRASHIHYQVSSSILPKKKDKKDKEGNVKMQTTSSKAATPGNNSNNNNNNNNNSNNNNNNNNLKKSPVLAPQKQRRAEAKTPKNFASSVSTSVSQQPQQPAREPSRREPSQARPKSTRMASPNANLSSIHCKKEISVHPSFPTTPPRPCDINSNFPAINNSFPNHLHPQVLHSDTYPPSNSTLTDDDLDLSHTDLLINASNSPLDESTLNDEFLAFILQLDEMDDDQQQPEQELSPRNHVEIQIPDHEHDYRNATDSGRGDFIFLRSFDPSLPGNFILTNWCPDSFHDNYISYMPMSVGGASRSQIEDLPTRAVAPSRKEKMSKMTTNQAGTSRAHATQGQAELDSNNEENENCSICLMNYSKGEQIRTLPCLHCFHSKCVDKWLLQKGECPICKHTI